MLSYWPYTVITPVRSRLPLSGANAMLSVEPKTFVPFSREILFTAAIFLESASSLGRYSVPHSSHAFVTALSSPLSSRKGYSLYSTPSSSR